MKYGAYIAAILLFSSCLLFAQDGELKTYGVIVKVGFEPAITDARKIHDRPLIKDSVIPVPEMKYSVTNTRIETGYEAEPIKAAKFKGEKLEKLYQAYVKGGVGNYATPYAEIYYNTGRSRKHSLGFHARHLSSAATLKGKGYSGYSENRVDVYGKRFLRKTILSGGLDFSRDVVHYYGFDSDDARIEELDIPVDKKDIRQRFASFTVNAGLQSPSLDTNKLHYKAGVLYNRFLDLYGISEDHVRADVTGGGFMGEEHVQLGFHTDYYRNALLADTGSAVILNLNPRVNSIKGNLSFTLGLNLFLESDSVRNTEFYPDLRVAYRLIKNILTAYARGYGKVERNGLSSLAAENPFVATTNPLFGLFNRREAGIMGGLKGALSSKTSFNISFTAGNVFNMALFVNDTSQVLQNKFIPVYDDVKLTNMHGELLYDHTDCLRIILAGDYYKYTPSVQAEAWHKPSVQLSLSARYNLRNKIIAQADVFYYGKRLVSDYSGTDPVKELGAITDVSLGLEYRYTKILSAFIRLNNLLGSRYELWNQFPSQRLNVIGGFTWSLFGDN